jgi:hypothetical protein
MTENQIDLLTNQEITSLKKLPTFNFREIYFDNTFVLKGDWGIAYSDTCICFKGQNSWLSIGQKTTSLNSQEYGSLAVFESTFPKDHPNSKTDKICYIPNTKEQIANPTLTIKNLFVYTVTERLDNEISVTYDCGIEINFEENLSFYIYSEWNRTFAIHKTFSKSDFLKDYSRDTLSNLTSRQII